MVEYTGSFPDKIKPHGNSKIENPPPFLRTNPEVVSKIEKADRKVGPNELYDNLVRDNDIMDAPRNPRQIVNKQVYQKKKDQTHSSCNNCHHNKNVADHMQQLFNMLNSHPFVQGVCSTPALSCIHQSNCLI